MSNEYWYIKFMCIYLCKKFAVAMVLDKFEEWIRWVFRNSDPKELLTFFLRVRLLSEVF